MPAMTWRSLVAWMGMLAVLAGGAAQAQEAQDAQEAQGAQGAQDAQEAREARTDRPLQVSLLTVGPGGAAYELFGHNAIIIRDGRTGRGWAFNYGVFDFEQEHFYGRFIQGRLLYEMAAFDADAMIQAYIDEDRSMWEQALHLSPAQSEALFEYLRGWVGRQYLYDYYLNNCSTQLRDALDSPGVLDGALRAWTESTPTDHSFRWHTRRLTRPRPLLYLALEMVLGSPIDRPISRWEEMFLPQSLLEVVMGWGDGRHPPLADPPRQIYQSTRFTAPQRPPVWAGWFLLIGLLVGGGLIVLEQRGRARIGADVGFVSLGVLWCLLLGAGGAISLWGWLFTDHWATRWNENVLLANVLALGLVVLLPMMRRRDRARRGALWLVRAILLLAGAAVGVSLFTRGIQYNFDVMALVLPVWVALAVSLGRRGRWIGPSPASAGRIQLAGRI